MMKPNRKLATLTLVGALVFATCLTGCGRRVATAPEAEVPAAEEPAPAPSVEPSAPPVTNPGYEQPPVITGSLVVSNVEKKKKGLIFKKLVVKGSILNTSNQPLSGTIKIDFKESKGIINKSFVTSETQTQVVAQLAPGQSMPFEVTSEKNGADDAEVTVETSAATAATMAPGYAAGGLYGQATMGAASYPVAQPQRR